MIGSVSPVIPGDLGYGSNLKKTDNRRLNNYYADKVSFSGLIPDNDLNNIKMHVFDLDGTFMEGDPEDRRRVVELTRQPGKTLVYASRRTLEKMLLAVKQTEGMPFPDYFAGSDGQRIYENRGYQMHEITEWSDGLKKTFDKDKIRGVIGEIGENRLKEYTFYDSDLGMNTIIRPGTGEQIRENLASSLEKAGVKAVITIQHYTRQSLAKYMPEIPQERQDILNSLINEFGRNDQGGYDDIYISAAGKGQAVKYLQDRLKLRPGQVVTAGDDTNDSSMAELSGQGTWFVLVNNASEAMNAFVKNLPGRDRIIWSTKAGITAIREAIEPDPEPLV